MSSQRPKHTLWVGAAGTGTAYGLCVSARSHFGDRVRIVAADIHPAHLVAASAIADAFEQMPPVADARFATELLERLGRHQVDTYQPILDEEIVLAARLHADGRMPAGVTVLAPAPEAAAACFDKIETARRLVAAGLPSPRTELVADARWEGTALMVKPRFGRGSIGARVVTSEAELAVARADESLIAQELCSGPELTIDAFCGRRRQVFRAVCRERIEVKAGVCTKARIFEDESLESLAERLAATLGLSGAFCFQVMHGQRGEPLVTDVNPRPGAGTRMSAAAGVDPLLASLLDVWGRDAAAALPRLAADRFVVRSYVEHVFVGPP